MTAFPIHLCLVSGLHMLEPFVNYFYPYAMLVDVMFTDKLVCYVQVQDAVLV